MPGSACAQYAALAGSFGDRASARKAVSELGAYGIYCATEGQAAPFKVLCGRMLTRDEAVVLKRDLMTLGYIDATVAELPPPLPAFTPRARAGSPKALPELKALQVGGFQLAERAASTIALLGQRGLDCRSYLLEGLHKVLCGQFAGVEEAAAMKQLLMALGYNGAFVVALPEVQPENLQMKAAPPPPALPVAPLASLSPVAKAAAAMPAPVVLETGSLLAERIDADVLGRRAGYLHPFASVMWFFNNNLFNTRGDRVSDTVLNYSAGLWMALPGMKGEGFELLDTSASTPGGGLSHQLPATDRHLQAYLSGKADAERYTNNEKENNVAYKASALLIYNMKNGSSVVLEDLFKRGHEPYGYGVTNTTNTYVINRAGAALDLALSERVSLLGQYASFRVRYHDEYNKYRDRTDSLYRALLSVDLLPKTSLLLEYDFTALDYREDVFLDSVEQNALFGIRWDVTEKTTGVLKAGVTNRRFKDKLDGRPQSRDFMALCEVNYVFSPKTSMNLALSRGREETDSLLADYRLVTSAYAQMTVAMTTKLLAILSMNYMDSSYRPVITLGGIEKEREDQQYTGTFALKYKTAEWLDLSLGYTYDTRFSTFSDYDYITNRFSASASAAF